MQEPETRETVSTGIVPVDERTGGLEAGGVYLLTGTPGPARLVAAVQFIEAGLRQGERCLLLASGDLRSTLDLARAWGFDLEPAWRDGSLTLLGFQDDFEMRALRSVEPGAVLSELEDLAGDGPSRIAVHPGSLFLGRDTRNLLGRSFLTWAREQPATVCVTLPGEESDAAAGPSADWVFQEVTGRMVFSRRGPRLFQIVLERNTPLDGHGPEAITVELRPEQGLVVPEEFPQRRREDRPGLDQERILVVVLDDEVPADLAAWARGSFTADIVRGPLEAVARMNGKSRHGGVLLYGGRATIGDVTRAVRAIRPLTRAALLFASDDEVRSSDRIRLLESGADDCLTGGLNFQELGVRLRQAMASTRRTTPEDGGNELRPPATVGGPVDRQTLAWEARRRAAEPGEAVFAVVALPARFTSVARLEEFLAAEIRDEEGDLVARDTDGCLLLLQGARPGQVEAFLDRVRTRLGNDLPESRAGVSWACNPSDRAGVRALLEERMGIRG